MNDASPSCAHGLHLVTLGTAALEVNGTPIRLRKKDLALLVYLRLEGRHGHARGVLAGLLWGSSPEENARHSLTQALGRLRAHLGDALEVGHDRVGVCATLRCDASALQSAAACDRVDDGALALCAGEFLAGFHPGRGAEAFQSWADGRRAHLRTAAVTVLDRLGAHAEAHGDWERALAAGQRAVELEPASEPAHRRIMRAWTARGHRVRALQHYDRLTRWLSAEFETEAETETVCLAEQLRSRPGTRPGREPPPQGPGLPPGLPLPADPGQAKGPRPGHPPSVRAREHRAWGGVAAVAVLIGLLWNSGALLGLDWRPAPTPEEPPPAVQPPLAPAGSAVRRLDHWLRTDGRWIYYRYEAWMPGACDLHPTRAVGNWGQDGQTVGAEVHCIDRAWLALDVARLEERFSIEPQTTYCLDFLYVTRRESHWGQHADQPAPGLDSIRVVAPDGSSSIGFAIVREGPGRPRVRLTNAYPALPC